MDDIETTYISMVNESDEAQKAHSNSTMTKAQISFRISNCEVSEPEQNHLFFTVLIHVKKILSTLP